MRGAWLGACGLACLKIAYPCGPQPGDSGGYGGHSTQPRITCSYHCLSVVRSRPLPDQVLRRFLPHELDLKFATYGACIALERCERWGMLSR